MLEIAGLSTFLDILQKSFGLIEKRKDQKRRLFEEIIEPIYTQLSPVVDEYYKFFRGCRDEITQDDGKSWKNIVIMRRKQREEIVLARNRVIGMVSPFLNEARKRGEQGELLYKFAEGIYQFFYSSNTTGTSHAGKLLQYIELWADGKIKKEFVIARIEFVLQRLEHSWRDISAAYGELRVYCLS